MVHVITPNSARRAYKMVILNIRVMELREEDMIQM